MQLQDFGEALSTISIWLLPERIPLGIRLAVLSALLAAGAIVAARALAGTRLSAVVNHLRANDLALCLLGFGLSYLAVLVISRSLAARWLPFDYRLLSPLYVLAVIGVPAMLWRVTRKSQPGSVVRRLSVLACLVFCGLSAVRIALWWDNEERLEYGSRTWATSETLALVRDLPPRVTIYSNVPDAIYFAAGRETNTLPRTTVASTGEPRPASDREREVVRSALEQGALILWFDRPAREHLVGTEADMRSSFDVALLASTQDGRIYGRAGRAPALRSQAALPD
jgi:hypothetical protein